LTNYKGTVIVD